MSVDRGVWSVAGTTTLYREWGNAIAEIHLFRKYVMFIINVKPTER